MPNSIGSTKRGLSLKRWLWATRSSWREMGAGGEAALLQKCFVVGMASFYTILVHEEDHFAVAHWTPRLR
jgi:hypothetical protein